MKKKIQSKSHPYHISARCVNKEPYPIAIEETWKIYENYLYFLIQAFSFKIHSFVLMPNHFHLLCLCPKGNLSEGMNYFMRETSREINKAANRINQLYGRPFYASLISDLDYYFCAYKYVYFNPVKSNLVSKVEDYPFSTLYYKLGREPKSIIICDDDLFNENDIDHYLKWLNRPYKKKHINDIQRSFKKQEMKFNKKSVSLKEIVSEVPF